MICVSNISKFSNSWGGTSPSDTPSHEYDGESQNILKSLSLMLAKSMHKIMWFGVLKLQKFSNPLMDHIPLRHPFHLDMMGKVKLFFLNNFLLNVSQNYTTNYMIRVLKFQKFLTTEGAAPSYTLFTWIWWGKDKIYLMFLLNVSQKYAWNHMICVLKFQKFSNSWGGTSPSETPFTRIWWRKPKYFNRFVLKC